jgi:hypothetical protein
MRYWIIAMLSLVLFAGSVMAQETQPAEYPDTGAKVADLLIVRPLSTIGAGITTAFFMATLPLTFTIGVSKPAARALVEGPWRFVGGRYLGYWDTYKDGKPITVVRDGE